MRASISKNRAVCVCLSLSLHVCVCVLIHMFNMLCAEGAKLSPICIFVDEKLR